MASVTADYMGTLDGCHEWWTVETACMQQLGSM